MPKIFSKSVLLQPRIPTLFVVGLLVAQYLIFGSGNSPKPECTLKVQQPHYSTYLKEYKDLDAIKLNITSTCNMPQKYTQINSSIQEIANGNQITSFDFKTRRRNSSIKSPNTAIFKDLYVLCIKGSDVSYSGEAKGYVYLKDGREVKVQGVSGKYLAVPCAIVAR
jgi:hypothetical protein